MSSKTTPAQATTLDTKNVHYASAQAKAYFGTKAKNVRLSLNGTTAAAQMWENEQPVTELESEEITTASRLFSLITECRNTADAADGQIRMLEPCQIVTTDEQGYEVPHSFGKSGAKFFDFLQALALEEAEMASGQGLTEESDEDRENLAEALQVAVNGGKPATEEPTQKLKDLMAGKPVEGSDTIEGAPEVPELDLVNTMAEQLVHPGLKHNYAFPKGLRLSGSLSVSITDGIESFVYTFPGEQDDPSEDGSSGRVEIAIVATAGADDDASQVIELPLIAAINHMMNLVDIHTLDHAEFRMVDTLRLEVPALELDYDYVPEGKQKKITPRTRVEYGTQFVVDLIAMSVPTYTPFDLRMHSDFSFEDFAHVAACYGASLSKRCRNANPSHVLVGKVEMTGWITVTTDEGPESLLLSGTKVIDGSGAEISMAVALTKIMESDKITFMPDTRLQEAARSSNLKYSVEALTGVQLTIGGEKKGIVYTSKGLRTMLTEYHTKQVKDVAEEVKKVNRLVDSELSVVFSELMVDLPADDAPIKAVKTVPRAR